MGETDTLAARTEVSMGVALSPLQSTGRKSAFIIGALIIAQMAGSAVVNFFAEAPLFEGGGFLVNAASHSQQIAIAVLLAIVIEATWVAIAILAFPILAERSVRSALALFAISIVCLVIGVVENAGVMSMVSLSQAYSTASPADRTQLEAIRIAVGAARNWPHYLGRIFDGIAALTFYVALFRFAMVPRVIAGLGIIAVASMVTWPPDAVLRACGDFRAARAPRPDSVGAGAMANREGIQRTNGDGQLTRHQRFSK